ncbi:MAG: DoxX family protein, partial [Cyclobacteriaceae bacterium]
WGIPAPITWLVILGESVGMVLLIIGLGTRLVSASLGLIMVGAIYFVHWNNGFFMNWYSEANRGEGLEFHLLVFTLVIALIIKGGGKWSVDGILAQK